MSIEASDSTAPLNPGAVGAAPPSRLARLRAQTRQKWEELKAADATPERLGLAFGVGVFWAFSPFHGFQWLLCLATAWIFKLNKVAALIGLQVTLPPLVPLVLFIGVQAGALLLHQHFLPLGISQLRELAGNHLARELLLDLLVGGLVVGAIMGTIAGFLATGVIRRQRARQAAAI